ncbi:hypothetical protein I6I18_09450 [Kytococcus sedentarius]|uniref:hypothetical protein n=1 Tax=Kytococcus sedentarius TaxID=1276 RepID=UPI0011C01ED4|nr:hypothetical protein [Kytococcus sedentarius]QQB63283.1 hypothetical protein I6I18_09450 [Kytococcus sedentarius]
MRSSTYRPAPSCTFLGSPPSDWSRFSGHRGLDVDVEHAPDDETIWFAGIKVPVARVLAHSWPDAPNLGETADIDWNTVRLADILRGGFAYQRRGARTWDPLGISRTWRPQSRHCNPKLAVIENVRRLLSANCNRQPDPRRGAPHDDRNPEPATAVRNQEHAQAFLARSTLR